MHKENELLLSSPLDFVTMQKVPELLSKLLLESEFRAVLVNSFDDLLINRVVLSQLVVREFVK